MKFYAQTVFPFLLDNILNRPDINELRRDLLSEVQGQILEIGFGTGLNLEYYPPSISKITVIDNNPGMRRRAQKRLRSLKIKVDYQLLSGERLPFPAEAFDSVVSTFTLCSIKNVFQALSEVRRILKPGGKFYFLEHGKSKDPKVVRLQNWLTPLQKRLADGCHLNRNIEEFIKEASLKIISCKTFYLPDTPKFAGYFYQGSAKKI